MKTKRNLANDFAGKAQRMALQFAGVHPNIRGIHDYRDYLKMKFESERDGKEFRRYALNPVVKKYNPKHFDFIPDPDGVYPGEQSLVPFLLAAVDMAPTLDPANGYVTIMPGVQSKLILQKGFFTGDVRLYNCEGTDSGTLESKDFEISVCSMEYSTRACREQLIGSIFETWTRDQNLGLGGELPLPPELQDLYITGSKRRVKSQMENIAWRGDSGNISFSEDEYLGTCTGFLKRINDSDETIKVGGTVLTSDNFFDEWDDKIVPAAQSGSIVLSHLLANQIGNLIAYVSNQTLVTIRTALRKESNNHQWERGEVIEGELRVDGVRIVASPAIPNNTIILTFAETGELFDGGNVRGNNLWLVTDQESNFEEVIFERVANTDYYRVRLKFRMGTAIPYPEHLLIYKP